MFCAFAVFSSMIVWPSFAFAPCWINHWYISTFLLPFVSYFFLFPSLNIIGVSLGHPSLFVGILSASLLHFFLLALDLSYDSFSPEQFQIEISIIYMFTILSTQHSYFKMMDWTYYYSILSLPKRSCHYWNDHVTTKTLPYVLVVTVSVVTVSVVTILAKFEHK